MEDSRNYYKRDSAMSAAGVGEVRALPRDIGKLCRVVQGLLIHRDLASFLYGVTLSPEQRDAANARRLSETFARVFALDAKPLDSPRDPARRLPSVCRHFALMLCGILRAQGVPARARCGFAAYFTSGKFEDHWVCEYWNPEQDRWMLVDAQLDDVQRENFRPDFDPLDVPRDRFILAGDAWADSRSGRVDPHRFGLSFIPGLHGHWFIAGNVIRDLAALNAMEMLPWDVWGMMRDKDADLDEPSRKHLDRVASLTLCADRKPSEMRDLYDSDDGLRVPSVVFNVDRGAPEKITE
jgi:hypothetical protein